MLQCTAKLWLAIELSTKLVHPKNDGRAWLRVPDGRKTP